MGTAVLCGIWLVYNHYAWKWGSDTTRRVFSNGPAPVYAFWSVDRLWPLDELWPRLVPIIPAAGWIAFVVWQWRRAGHGVRGIAWTLVPTAIIFSFMINCSTAMMDGQQLRRSLAEPFYRTGLEYIGDVPQVRDRPARFMADYPQLQLQRRFFTGRNLISTHGATHPPGPTLLLWAAGKLFGTGPFAAALVTIVLSALAPAATWWLAQAATRLVQWQSSDRNLLAVAAVGMHVLSPSAVLFGATCVDAIFVAPLIASMAAILAAYAASSWRATLLYAATAGVLASLSLLLTFGTACLAVFFGLEFLFNLGGGKWKRRVTTLAMACVIVTITVAVLYWTIGYDTVACLRSAMRRNDLAVGTGYETVSRYFDLSIAHLLALLIGMGFAAATMLMAVGALTAWRTIRRISGSGDALVLAYLASMPLLAFSGLFTLEVERVLMWTLPPGFIIAAAALVQHPARRSSAYALVLLLGIQFAQTWAIERWMYVFW